MIKNECRLSVVVCAFNVNTKEGEAGRYCEFESCLLYIASSRMAKIVQCNPVCKKNQWGGLEWQAIVNAVTMNNFSVVLNPYTWHKK